MIGAPSHDDFDLALTFPGRVGRTCAPKRNKTNLKKKKIGERRKQRWGISVLHRARTPKNVRPEVLAPNT